MLKLLKYYWPHIKKRLFAFVAILFVYAIGTTFFRLVLPIIYKNIIDYISTHDPKLAFTGVLALLASYIFFNLIAQSGYSSGNYVMSTTQSKILKDIAFDAFERLQRHSHTFFSNQFIGSLVAKARRYTDSFETLHDQFVFTFWLNGLHLVFAISVLWYYTKFVGILFLVWSVLFIIVTKLILNKKRKLDLAHAEAKSKTTGELADILTNILTVKMFAKEEYEKTRFNKTLADEEAKRTRAWRMGDHQRLFQGVFTMIFQVSVLALSVYLWGLGEITAGVVALAYMYAKEVSDLVWNLGRSMGLTVSALSDAQEMVDIFEIEPDVKDPEKPLPFTVKKGDIDIEKIKFQYSDDEKRAIFNNFSLHIKSGEKVGLVGHSGSGKTTLVKLLLRFFDVQEGEIKIDGQNIKNVLQSDLRKYIAFVPQEPLLFHRSIAENIGYGKEGATFDEIVQAAKLANAHEFIEQLPERYDTFVGERGVKLSGGQRQRIAIARAILKDAPILILDEATSALDSESEKLIQEALLKLMENKTAIVVAHRLSTIKHLDRLLVFENGKIIEEGTHEELINKGGKYATFWKYQSESLLGD